MPTYEFRCEKCDTRVEVFQSMSAPAPARCGACGAENAMVKVLFAPAVHYKGSGFYATDYAGKKKSSSTSESSSGSDSSSTSSTGDTSSPVSAPSTSPAASDS